MNYNKYIGLPYKENGRTIEGLDCWGLARLFYKNEFDIELPSYTELYDGSYDPKVVAAIDYYKDGWQLTTNPKTGDLCLFKILGQPSHIGVYIGNRKFLHSRDGSDVAIESLDNYNWNRRFSGFYRYHRNDTISIYGAPNPMQWASTKVEVVNSGTTCAQFAKNIIQKYNIGKKLASKLLLTIDGKIIPQHEWDTTILQSHQTVNYRVVAQGRQGLRIILTIAVFVISQDPVLAAKVGAAFGTTAAVGSAIIQIAGTILINAAFPIRPPTTNDPGQAIGTSLFSGTQNQANPFGAIPVVLGKTRQTAVLGATPYIETLSNTNLLHLLLIWGFGPLHVDTNSISAGATPLAELHSDKLVDGNSEIAYTLFGTVEETQAETDKFNSYYPSDLQQLPASPVELVNNPTDGNPWTSATFSQPATNIEVAFNFGEGLRKIATKDGKTSNFSVSIGIEVVPANQVQTNPNLDTTISSNLDYYYLTANTTINATIPTAWVIDDWNTPTKIYQKYTIALKANSDAITLFAGCSTDIAGNNPSLNYKSHLASSGFENLLGTQVNYLYEPQIPSGYLKVASFILDSDNNVTGQVDHITGISGFTRAGLALTSLNRGQGYDYSSGSADLVFYAYYTATISGGSLTSTTNSSTNAVTQLTVFNARTNLPSVTNVTRSDTIWHNFLEDYGVWGTANISTATTFDQQTNITFPYDGIYTIDLSADDQGALYIGDLTNPIFEVSRNFSSYSTKETYISAGTKTVRITASSNEAVGNTNQSSAGVACIIRYVYDGVKNVLPTRGYKIITIDRNSKDAFNYVYKLENIPRNTYAIRVKRITNDDSEQLTDYRIASKVSLLVATAYDSKDNPPLKPLPARKLRDTSGNIIATQPRNLARTAIKIQSTNKVNGTIAGINAVVQTIGKIDIAWNSGTNTASYNIGPTNNPASLFVHVLQHTANTYSVLDNEIDWVTISSWYNFCNASSDSQYLVNNGQPILTYNNVVTNTNNLMELLRDICAAGMASPTYINGKWSVVIDRQRTFTVQHFTPHNSWGFDSTKTLVRIPDAFRVSFPNETKTYQADELIVYNYGYGETDGYIVNAGSFVSGRTYKITKFGNTNWNIVAGTTGVSYVVGDTFVAAGLGSGTGQAFTTQGSSGRAVVGAEVFEQLQLPGVTNPDQIRYFAQWHLAQLKLRPEKYTINVDFEYLVCTRGDLVKVTHDVPLWGIGSARIKSISGNTITLTEAILLDNTKSYSVTIRTNNLTASTQGSVTKTLVPVGSSGYYNSITTTTSFSGVVVDNLVMIGETNKVTQDLIVESIEPSSDLTARITLVDYSPSIYTLDLLNDYIHFNSNITLQNIDIVKTTVTKSPIIEDIVSSNYDVKEISQGTYTTSTTISFSNPSDLPITATKVQFQIVESNRLMDDISPQNVYYTNKETGSLIIEGLTAQTTYKVRARYTNNTTDIFSPWTEEQQFYVESKTINSFTPNNLQITLEGTNIVVKPTLATGVTVPADHKTYEFRLYRSSVGITNNNSQDQDIDFWDTSWDATNMLKAQSRTQAVFNLLDLPSSSGNRRISVSGVNYRIACRALNNTDNYSATSVLGSIKIKTIQ